MMTRENRRWPLWSVILLMPLLATFSSFVLAQEEEPAAVTPAEAVAQGAEALGRLDTVMIEIGRYGDMLAVASAEDSLVLRLQLAGAQDRFMDEMGELATVLAADGDDPARGELRARAEAVYLAVTPRIWELVGELRAEVDGIRAGRPGTPPADRLMLEEDLALLTGRLDRIFKYGWTHIGTMESLGLETVAARDTLAILLNERADELSGRLGLASQRLTELDGLLKDSPGDADLEALKLAAGRNLDINIASQETVLGIMGDMELPADRYRAQLVTLTGSLASGLLDAKVAAKLSRQAWGNLKSWAVDNGPTFLVKVLLFLVIILAGRFLARLVSKAVDKSLARSKLDMSHLLKRMIVTFTKNAIIILALVFGLAQLGLSLGPLLAGFGVVGFILGFAMQDSLSNLAAGMMILINRPYDVGDLVEISGVYGKVEQMSMVSTSVLTLDNQKLVVPNSRIWGDVIKNVTDQRVRRVDMTFGISYTDDIPHAEQVLTEILKSHELVLDDPEPVVRLHTLNDSSVDFVVRPWVRTDEYWNVYWDVTRAVKMRFDEEGISIPFPQRDVHVYEQKKLTAIGGDLEQDPVAPTGQTEPDVGDE
ncbi:MAG: mechanosensitive ion channel family protein [Candidatus Krumholzibacteriota bacterium]